MTYSVEDLHSMNKPAEGMVVSEYLAFASGTYLMHRGITIGRSNLTLDGQHAIHNKQIEENEYAIEQADVMDTTLINNSFEMKTYA
ncbi:MAG: hypothetical protein C3F13_15500 [Anaerolineales bacterium]|nr:MAG: hypothetical protein C3F13_15500 [Anaerolineales bacterium]